MKTFEKPPQQLEAFKAANGCLETLARVFKAAPPALGALADAVGQQTLKTLQGLETGLATVPKVGLVGLGY